MLGSLCSERAYCVMLSDIDPNTYNAENTYCISRGIAKMDNSLMVLGNLPENHSDRNKHLQYIVDGISEVSNIIQKDMNMQLTSLSHQQRINILLKFMENAAQRDHAQAAGIAGVFYLFHEDPALIHNDENDIKGRAYISKAVNFGANSYKPLTDAFDFEDSLVTEYKNRYQNQLPMISFDRAFNLYSLFSQETFSKHQALVQKKSPYLSSYSITC